MKTEAYQGDQDRLILTSMIVDKTVLGRIADRWSGRMFASDWANKIASWCVTYYKNYGEAPGKNIEPIYRTWVSEGQSDKDTAEIIGKLLSSLSRQYETKKRDTNSEFVIDIAGKHFNKVRAEQLKEEMEQLLETNEVERIYQLIAKFTKVDIGIGQCIDPFSDKEALQEALTPPERAEDDTMQLVRYPGPMSKFMDHQMRRGNFVSFEGPEGSGKSRWLLDLAYRGVMNRRRVMFIDCGDMTRNQILHRLAPRVARHPLYASKINYPKEVKWEDNNLDITFKKKVFTQNLNMAATWDAIRKVVEGKIRSEDSFFKLFTFANSTLSVSGLQSLIDEHSRQGWVPDIVVLDYVDIMAYPPGFRESRDSINEVWKGLRRISQEINGLVVTATQTNRGSYTAEVIGKEHAGEDKRKNAHITGMIGINQKPEEMEKSVTRLNWVKLREQPPGIVWTPNRFVYAVGCPAIANPCVLSTL